MPVKLPESLRSPDLPNYTIGAMPVGAEHYVESTALVVDSTWSCYLRPDAQLSHGGFLTVKRSEDGYHVTFQLPVQLSPLDPPNDEKEKLIPVVTVTLGVWRARAVMAANVDEVSP